MWMGHIVYKDEIGYAAGVPGDHHELPLTY